MYKSSCTSCFPSATIEALLTIIEYLLLGEKLLYSQLPYQYFFRRSTINKSPLLYFINNKTDVNRRPLMSQKYYISLALKLYLPFYRLVTMIQTIEN